jgi:hypothetical protein
MSSLASPKSAQVQLNSRQEARQQSAQMSPSQRELRTFSRQERKEVPVAPKEKSRQEEPVTPDPRADMRTLSGQARKEVPVAPKIKSRQEKPTQEKAQREQRHSQSPAGLKTLATLCSGLTTNSVSAGAVSPT